MNFLPHGFCFLWESPLLWLHVVSDLLTALAYYSIPVALVYFVRRRVDLEFRGIFVMFAAFIVACGTTHLLGVWTIWQPDYWAAGLVKAITAAVSVSTALVLWRVMPTALALPSPAQLRQSNQRLEQAMAEQRRARQALEESEARFRGAFDFAPIGMALVSPQGQWLQVNAALCEIVGYSEGELLENDFQNLTHPDDLARDLEYMEELLAGKRHNYQMEKRYFHRDGHTVWILLSVSLVRRSDGEPLYFVSQIQDITERHRAAQALRQARDDLEVRVAERTRELTDAHRRKDDFLAMLGHELRNPLAPIRNAVEILRLDDGGLTRRQLWARDIIDRQTRQLSRLVNDLLDVARISRGRIELKKRPIDLAQTVDQAVESVRPLVDERRQQLAVTVSDPSPVVQADPDRLTQALVNLLNNAARYTPEGGHIQLQLTREGEEAVIRVRDDGVGIGSELLPRVFDQFVQGDQTLDRSQGGLGLGLALVRSIGVLHGGRVEAHSDGAGQGSEFIMRLPLLDGPAAADNPQRGIAGQGRRILLAEDNLDLAGSLQTLLTLMGHEVWAVHDGEAALTVARQWHPQVIFLDIGLPGRDGYSVARAMVEEKIRPGLLVALTGYGQEDDVRRAREAGFDRHLLKPVTLETLGEVLDTPPMRPSWAEEDQRERSSRR